MLVVFGTRPDAIKMAPVCIALKADKAFDSKILVTAQHRHMLDQVLRIFRLKTDYDLNIMEESQTLFHITGETLRKMEKVLKSFKPNLVLVHGDTTTAYAASLSAFFLHIPVGHVEAGLRSFDMENPFPEEANRVLTDALSALHFAPTKKAKDNLLRERKSKKSIFITGNTVIDALLSVVNKPCAMPFKKLKTVQSELKNSSKKMILMTAHRRENFGKPLENIFKAIKRIAQEFPETRIVYPVHLNPRVHKPAYRILGSSHNVILVPPVDYNAMAQCIKKAYFVVTDSGGIQEEAPSLGKPVLVLRKVTERPEAVKAGTVKIIGTEEKDVYTAIKNLLTNTQAYNAMSNAVNPYGDGKASKRIIQAIKYWAGKQKKKPHDFKSSK